MRSNVSLNSFYSFALFMLMIQDGERFEVAPPKKSPRCPRSVELVLRGRPEYETNIGAIDFFESFAS